ncbi:MAG: hypothetical protein HC888_00295 [Candidatus Competibacteraceae bacterium]|nr:hypothetical protein [Candidatus Competibacteraceae bacterium]
MNHNVNLLAFLLQEYKGDIHISLGMTTCAERASLLESLKPHAGRVVFYHCTSAYPCPFESLYLYEVQELSKSWPRVGYSNHGKGIASDIAALAMGARYFERHFVDDRMFPHTDASSSLEATGLSKLCRDLRNVHSAFRFKPICLDPLEVEQRDKLRGPIA